jgi:DNA anti-recombination protein RmuC
MMSGLIDKLKKQLEEEVQKRVAPLIDELREIKKIQEEQLKVLKEIKRLLERGELCTA